MQQIMQLCSMWLLSRNLWRNWLSEEATCLNNMDKVEFVHHIWGTGLTFEQVDDLFLKMNLFRVWRKIKFLLLVFKMLGGIPAYSRMHSKNLTILEPRFVQGRKPWLQYELSIRITLLSLEYLLSYKRRSFHEDTPDHYKRHRICPEGHNAPVRPISLTVQPALLLLHSKLQWWGSWADL